VTVLILPPQLAAEQADLVADVDDVVHAHGTDRHVLIPVLQELQRRRAGLSDLAMQLVADRLGVPPVEVQGVVTFYAFLGTAGRHVVRVCRTLTCELAGARAVADALAADLGVPMGATTDGGGVTLEWANCIGLCDRAPAMLVDDGAHGFLTPASAVAVVAHLGDDDRPDAVRADEGDAGGADGDGDGDGDGGDDGTGAVAAGP
jgi:NADH:ubiquinone oxidoreductase subunit E